MKIEFNNLTEILDFLKEIGYKVTKQDCCGNCKKEGKESDEPLNILEKTFKTNPEDFKELPKNPFTPTYPYYPSFPIVTCVKEDPELSKKFSVNKSNIE